MYHPLNLKVLVTFLGLILTFFSTLQEEVNAQWVTCLDKDRDGGSNVYFSISSPDGTNIYVCGSIYMGKFTTYYFFDKSTDGGISWNRLDASMLPEPADIIHDNFYRIKAIDANTVIAVGDSGIIVTSHDGGASFQLRNDGSKLQLTDVDMNKYGIAVTSGNYGAMGLSEDTGKTWTFKELIGYTYFVNSRVFGKDTIYLIGNNRSIYRSYDRGVTWDSVIFHPIRYDLKKGMRPYDAYFWNSLEGVIVGYNQDSTRAEGEFNGIVMRTTNGGSTWTTTFDEWISGRANGFRCVDFFDHNNGVIGTGGDIILKTSDGGLSWGYDTIVVSNPVLRIKDDILCLADNNVITNVLTDPAYGMIVRSDRSAGVGGSVGLNHFYIFPNPATSQISISFATDLPTSVTIHDALGREVFHSTTHTNSFEYDCRALPPGAYFVKATSNMGITETSKFIKN